MRYYTDPRHEAAKQIAFWHSQGGYRSYEILDNARDGLASHCAAILRGEGLGLATARERLADARVLAHAEKLLDDRRRRLLERWQREREAAREQVPA